MTRVAVPETAFFEKLMGLGEKDALAPEGRPSALKLMTIGPLLVFVIVMA
jgi:hypothetical protein